MTQDNVIRLPISTRRITWPGDEKPAGEVRLVRVGGVLVIELRLAGKPALVLDRAEAALAYGALGEAIDALDAALEEGADHDA